MSTPAPLTRTAHGSTRCVGCSKKFTDTPDMPTTATEVTQYGWSGVDSAGQFRRSLTPHTVTRLWHTECRARSEAQAQESRDRAEEYRQAVIRSTVVAAVTQGSLHVEAAAAAAKVDVATVQGWIAEEATASPPSPRWDPQCAGSGMIPVTGREAGK